MERNDIQNVNHHIYVPLSKYKKNLTKEEIYEKIEEFEIKCQESITKTLSRVNVHSMVKTDRFSLPYKNEIKVTLYGESYLNGPYEFHRVARNIVKEILEKNIYHLRFYIFIQFNEGNGIFNPGSINYYFRYSEQIKFK